MMSFSGQVMPEPPFAAHYIMHMCTSCHDGTAQAAYRGRRYSSKTVPPLLEQTYRRCAIASQFVLLKCRPLNYLDLLHMSDDNSISVNTDPNFISLKSSHITAQCTKQKLPVFLCRSQVDIYRHRKKTMS